MTPSAGAPCRGRRAAGRGSALLQGHQPQPSSFCALQIVCGCASTRANTHTHMQTHAHVLFPACPALLPAAHPAPELLHAGAGAASSGSGYCYIALETN